LASEHNYSSDLRGKVLRQRFQRTTKFDERYLSTQYPVRSGSLGNGGLRRERRASLSSQRAIGKPKRLSLHNANEHSIAMSKRAPAFTLVEMLVALAITSLLVVLLVNVVSAALTVWEQGRNQIDTFANARQVLGRIADEISGATAAPAPRIVEFSENIPSIQGSTAPTAGKSENVFFVAPYPNVMSGDLCVIAYRHNDDIHTLERGFIDSQSAWNGAATNRYQSAGYTTQWQWRTIAIGVLEFEIQSYSQQDLDSVQTPATTWNSVTGGSVMLGNTPRQVIIRVKVVDDRTLTKLAGLTSGNPIYDRLVARAARQFTASVLLPSAH
jgi:prepilin-type N-terminal cleavage/methylation domain-containing protein